MKNTASMVVTTLALLGTAGAWAQGGNFPNRPIQVVMNSTPGSVSEELTRYLGQDVYRTLGQPLVIISKPSVNASIGTESVKRAVPDGYTLNFGSNTSMAANVHLVKKLGYAPMEDFEPVSLASLNPLVLVKRADLPVNTVQELVAYAKANPGKLNYGVGNAGGKVAVALLSSMTGFDALEIPFKGASMAVQEMLAGRVDFMAVDALVVNAHIKSGALKPLAVTSNVRLQSMPNVPTMEEAGIPGYEYTSYLAYYAPKGTPKDVVDKLNKAFNHALMQKETQEYYVKMGMLQKIMTPEELRRFTSQQIDYWAKLVKVGKMTVQ